MNVKAEAGTIHHIELGVKLLYEDGNPETAPRKPWYG